MTQPKQNLTGQQFNLLTVLEYLGNSTWLCQCSCGNQTQVRTSSLKSGKTKSCGCLRGQNTKHNTRNSKPKVDLTNQRFGYLIACNYIKGGKWKCKCDCGNIVEVDTRHLNSGHTKSCGCYVKEKNSQNNTIDMLGFENEYIKVLEKSKSDAQGVSKWKCLCKNCNNIFITRGSNIRNGDTKSCGCILSLNEKKISQMLSKNNIEFAKQYTFSDLKGVNGGALRFDFAIFYNGQLSHLIEFNGKQHYEKDTGKWAESFEVRQQNDKIKQEYCNLHNIQLRIIKYDQKYELKDLL